jgi:RNA polymerase sigma-70 factor (TIGR02960 family)
VRASTPPAETALVEAARAGDEAAFRELTEPYRRELHLHCYRMLGSLHDAEDAFQDTLLRAWRHLPGYEPRGTFRAWLYRIGTNVCLTAAAKRRPETAGVIHDVAGAASEGEAIRLAPYPDAFLDELPSSAVDPGAQYDLDESVQLAFVAAAQLLPPRQRAVLLLRDVLGFAASEVAELLETTPAGVNSALQRARATLEQRRQDGRLSLRRARPPSDVADSVVRRYVEAWRSVDIEGLVALLREDAVMTMPPEPLLFRGREAIGDFFAAVPANGALDQIPLRPTQANRQPAVAAYLLDPAAQLHRPYGLMVLSLDGDAIAEITGFVDPSLFPFFGLPTELLPESK